MKRNMFGLVALLSGFGLVGCGDDNPTVTPTPTPTTSYTKAEAAVLNGLAPDGADICELMDWYEDTECDEFCVEADEACESAPECDAKSLCDAGFTCEDGSCVEDPISPPMGCGAQNSCETGLYCAFPPSDACGAEAVTEGRCKASPPACDADLEPVCGCDGVTYDNSCFAAAAGQNVASEAACADSCEMTCGSGTCVDGECVEIPPACSTENPCPATQTCSDEGICVDSAPRACGARAGDTCTADEYCAFELDEMCGAADASGVCEPRPEFCTEQEELVCGCDGMTYGNACVAAFAGMGVLHDGRCVGTCNEDVDCGRGETCADGLCEPGPVACGARAGDTCTADEFCFFTPEAMCGIADAPGVCQPRPTACLGQNAPVCGCDQQTYSNTCAASIAGVGVMQDGACPTVCTLTEDCNAGETCANGLCVPGPVACGGRAGNTCNATTEWCNFGGPAAICGHADAQGVCTVRPENCLAVVMPVCGCDGMTYSNACVANAAGVDILSANACGASI